MSVRLTVATAARVLAQLRHDRRTLALLLLVPCLLVGLLAWVFDGTPTFDRLGGPLLGVFPFVVMFLVTSVATLRERQSGTLERLLAMPLAKADLVAGYALAFGALALVQAGLVTVFAVRVCGLDVQGSPWLLLLVAVADAVLGCTLGLFFSAFAASEFQAVQFLPAVVLPQFLLCGLIVPRGQLPDVLHGVSDVLPLSYAVDAMSVLTVRADGAADALQDLAVVAGFAVLAVVGGAATLRRRTA